MVPPAVNHAPKYPSIIRLNPLSSSSVFYLSVSHCKYFVLEILVRTASKYLFDPRAAPGHMFPCVLHSGQMSGMCEVLIVVRWKRKSGLRFGIRPPRRCCCQSVCVFSVPSQLIVKTTWRDLHDERQSVIDPAPRQQQISYYNSCKTRTLPMIWIGLTRI